MSEGKGLLMDSCGGTAMMTLFDGVRVLASGTVEGRGFSAAWPGVLRGLLGRAGWELGALQVIGVVHGPGSFTGVRVGLAAAKGLCEATGARLVAVSRLEVMERADGARGVVGLDAGRGEMYVRVDGVESLRERAEYEALLVQRAEGAFVQPSVYEEREAALMIVRKRWDAGRFDDVATVDANYVRGEREIYAKKAVLA